MHLIFRSEMLSLTSPASPEKVPDIRVDVSGPEPGAEGNVFSGNTSCRSFLLLTYSCSDDSADGSLTSVSMERVAQLTDYHRYVSMLLAERSRLPSCSPAAALEQKWVDETVLPSETIL